MKGFLHSMLVFYIITLVILYIPVSQKIEGEREREREREKLALVLDTYDLNLSTTLSKLDIVLQRHLRFLKGMFREDIKHLYVLFVFLGSD